MRRTFPQVSSPSCKKAFFVPSSCPASDPGPKNSGKANITGAPKESQIARIHPGNQPKVKATGGGHANPLPTQNRLGHLYDAAAAVAAFFVAAGRYECPCATPESGPGLFPYQYP